VLGGTHLALSYSGKLNEQQEQQMDMAGRLLLHTGSLGSFSGMLLGGVATQDVEGMDYGGTMGGFAEGVSAAGIGSWRLVSREWMFGRQSSYVWGDVYGKIQGIYGYGDAASRVRPNAFFPKGLERIELSHVFSQRSTKNWQWFFNRPWNCKPMWGSQHALSDPYRYQFLPQLWKAANPQLQGMSRFLQLAPDWTLMTGYGAAQVGGAAARDLGTFPGDGGTP
jgi:hypothetical protein